MIRYILAIALVANLSTAFAQESLPGQLSSDQEAIAIQLAETTGLAIYRHDHAAAVATDAIRKIRADKRVKGWVTEEQQDQIVVTFIDKTPAALYRVVVSKDGAVSRVMTPESPAQLTAFESGAATARSTAMASKFQPCSENYNSVVLPASDPSGENWVVYLLPGTTKNNVVPIGGTYRIETGDSNIIGQRSFTRTCIALHTDPSVAGLMITHLLDPIPTEAHVFWSLWANKPMYVVTPPYGTIWNIEDGKIKLVERKAGQGGS
jgi:hypothetical protein